MEIKLGEFGTRRIASLPMLPAFHESKIPVQKTRHINMQFK